MLEPLHPWLLSLDQRLAPLVAALLFPLGAYILVSGVDDLIIDLCWVRRLLLRRLRTTSPITAEVERGIAMFIPLWHEAEVIGPMLDHNLAAIDYRNYEVFVGVYLNDSATRQAVLAAQRRHPRVHLAEVPHDGPTCKADCLNWIYQRMLLDEEGCGRHFDVVVIHDAEDLIHAKGFERICRYAGNYDMIQIPVLALPTPLSELTHGVYCDDFAESQGKDLFTRVELGGFLPGCGVGTGFRREALERLAGAEANRLFNPASLTEDYDNGIRLHELGCRQAFIPLEFELGAPVATREYFPRRMRQAIRQRSRWILGNALQAWGRFGWGSRMPRRWVQAWFLWRDRKGLWGNPVSLVCNFLLVYGLLTWSWSLWEHRDWPLRKCISQSPRMFWLLQFNALLFTLRAAVRTLAVRRIYGFRFASGVPLRMLWGNWINTWAAGAALIAWTRSRMRGKPLPWLKTDHAYPSRGALLAHKRRLGEVLVANAYLTQQQVIEALASQPDGILIGEHMIALGLLTEDELYQALSLQQSLPRITVEPDDVPARIARSLPAVVAREWKVLPFRVRNGTLELLSPDVPSDEMHVALQRFTRLKLRFHLATRSNYDQLSRKLL